MRSISSHTENLSALIVEKRRPLEAISMVLSCVRVIGQWFNDTGALRVFWSVVLDLSAVELIFFPVASMGLCFQHRADNIEIFLLCSQGQALFCFSHCHVG